MITLKQFDGANVTPADDAALYAHFDGRNGIISGMEVAHLGANQILINSGRGLICGRTFVVEQETIFASLASGASLNGRLLVEIDLGNPVRPISFVTQAAASLPDLVQEDLNAGGSIFQLPLATYTVSSTAVSNLQVVPKLAQIFGEDGALPIENGGTGAKTVAAARNALGLGNTSGALPIANGGTGATTVAAARNALGLGNTSGALPIANGGTGATTAEAVRAALAVMALSGGAFTGPVTVKGLRLTPGVDFGSSFPTSDLTVGRVFFLEV